MRVGAPPAPIRTLEVRNAALGIVQAASHASSPTLQPVAPVRATPGEATTRRVPAHILDIRV